MKKKRMEYAINWSQYNGLMPSALIPPKNVIKNAATMGASREGVEPVPSQSALAVALLSLFSERSQITLQ